MDGGGSRRKRSRKAELPPGRAAVVVVVTGSPAVIIRTAAQLMRVASAVALVWAACECSSAYASGECADLRRLYLVPLRFGCVFSGSDSSSQPHVEYCDVSTPCLLPVMSTGVQTVVRKLSDSAFPIVAESDAAHELGVGTLQPNGLSEDDLAHPGQYVLMYISGDQTMSLHLIIRGNVFL